MFKPQVLRRNFSLFNRVPHSRIVRAAARDGHETVTIHRVRIRRPVISKSRLVGTLAIGAALYGLSNYIGIRIEVEEVQDDGKKSARQQGQWQQAGEEVEDDKDEDYDNALLFLPTGFSRPKPRTYYRGSDPEWQEFKKIAADQPRAERIRGELVSLVRGRAHKNVSWVALCGKINLNKGKVWIDVRFPDGPSIEYERPGIELTENLEWRKATRPVEAIHHHRLSRLFYPTQTANALYTDTMKKVGQSWKSFKVYMGWDPESKTDTVHELVQRIGSNPLSGSRPATSSADTVPNPLSTSSAKDTQQRAASSAGASAGGPTKDLGFILPDPKKMKLDLSQFRTDFRKAFKPYPPAPPRGAFLVTGLIEVWGDKARITLHVIANYDPKAGRYFSVHAHIFNITPHQQTPKGGP